MLNVFFDIFVHRPLDYARVTCGCSLLHLVQFSEAALVSETVCLRHSRMVQYCTVHPGKAVLHVHVPESFPNIKGSFHTILLLATYANAGFSGFD